jgi:UDP-N-acetylmuramate--alanine ligase
VLTVSGEAELAPAIAPLLGAGDMVICLGAGDITKWAANLAGALKTAGAA